MTNERKQGYVSEVFSSGDFAVWCKADRRLYMYRIENGQVSPTGRYSIVFHLE